MYSVKVNKTKSQDRNSHTAAHGGDETRKTHPHSRTQAHKNSQQKHTREQSAAATRATHTRTVHFTHSATAAATCSSSPVRARSSHLIHSTYKLPSRLACLPHAPPQPMACLPSMSAPRKPQCFGQATPSRMESGSPEGSQHSAVARSRGGTSHSILENSLPTSLPPYLPTSRPPAGQPAMYVPPSAVEASEKWRRNRHPSGGANAASLAAAAASCHPAYSQVGFSSGGDRRASLCHTQGPKSSTASVRLAERRRATCWSSKPASDSGQEAIRGCAPRRERGRGSQVRHKTGVL